MTEIYEAASPTELKITVSRPDIVQILPVTQINARLALAHKNRDIAQAEVDAWQARVDAANNAGILIKAQAEA